LKCWRHSRKGKMKLTLQLQTYTRKMRLLRKLMPVRLMIKTMTALRLI